jgi:hypothetical protein
MSVSARQPQGGEPRYRTVVVEDAFIPPPMPRRQHIRAWRENEAVCSRFRALERGVHDVLVLDRVH